MTTTLEQVIADAKRTVETVERVGSTFSPAAVRDVVTAIERAAEDYLTWLPESTAMLQAALATMDPKNMESGVSLYGKDVRSRFAVQIIRAFIDTEGGTDNG